MAIFLAALIIVLAMAAPASAASPEDSYDGSDLWLRYERVDDRGRLAAVPAAPSPRSWSRTPIATRPTATPRTCAWSRGRASSSWTRRSRPRGTSSPGACADCSTGRCPSRPPASRPARWSSAPARAPRPSGGTCPATTSPRSATRASSSGRCRTGGPSSPGTPRSRALYGTFAFLRRMQTEKRITGLEISDSPRIENRHLNNWETDAPVRRQQRVRDRRTERRERVDLQLRRDRRRAPGATCP